jgi:hypothetical protein
MKVEWRITGESFGSCNCDWSCPCQFNLLPTHRRCEALQVWDIRDGHFGGTVLDGVRFAEVLSWPGAVHEGGGSRVVVLDELTSAPQREAVVALTNGECGHPFFEIYARMTPDVREPVVAAISVEIDREARRARLDIPGLAESVVAPIRNPVTDAEHRVRLDLPDGFEFKLAEIANSVTWHVTAAEPLSMHHENSWAHLYAFDLRSDGSTS